MTSNDLINLQKNALFNFHGQNSQLYINPFAERIFKRNWKWNQQHQLNSKTKQHITVQNPSLKKDILIWFENLNENQKISVTSISTPGFAQSFLKMLANRQTNRLFNLTNAKWVNGIEMDEEDRFFDELLEQLRVGYLTQPVLYFKSAKIMDIRMLNWLNKVSNSRVFQYASKSKKQQENVLWFSRLSYRYLQDWLANQIEIAIVKHYFEKNVPEFILPMFQNYLKNACKNAEVNGLTLTLLQAQKKTKSELTLLKSKLKQQEEKFLEFRQMNLLKSMEFIEETNKKKNKRKMKKKLTKDQETMKQNLDLKIFERIDEMLVDTDNTNSPSISKQKITQDTNKEYENQQTLKQKKEKIHVNRQQQIFKIQNINKSKEKSKLSRNKNYIKLSPKRKMSPDQIRRQKLFDTLILQQKYSQEDKKSFVVTQDQKFSQLAFSIQDPSICQKTGEKRRKKKSKKQNEKMNQVKQILYSRFICRQIDNLVDQLGIQTNTLYNHKIISFQRVRTFVQSMYPTANTVLFGSNAIGLSLPNSDVDILLTGLNCNCKQQASEFLAQIAVEINAMGWVVSCSTYLWAKVPIVKLQIDTTVPFLQTKRRQDLFRVYNPALLYHLDHVGEVKRETIKVDITINIEGITSVGYQSTLLMRDWIIKLPILQKLVVLMKFILSAQGYNSNFTGGIGSYCLFVMVAAFIKQSGKQNQGQQSKQFLNILKWYGQDFDNHSNVVWLREKGPCFPNENVINQQIQEGKRGLLRLIDPITQKYMNSSCNQYNSIKIEFRRILEEIAACKNIIQNELRLRGTTTPELLKVIQSKKSIDRWLNKMEDKHQFSLKAVIERTNN